MSDGVEGVRQDPQQFSGIEEIRLSAMFSGGPLRVEDATVSMLDGSEISYICEIVEDEVLTK